MTPDEKIVRRGEPNEELLRIIRVNSRAPETVMGKLNAEVASLRTGVARIRELYGKYGTDTVDASIERILAAGEEQARAAVRAMPDGEWEAEDWMDNDGVNGDLVRVHVRVVIKGGSHDDRLFRFEPEGRGSDQSRARHGALGGAYLLQEPDHAARTFEWRAVPAAQHRRAGRKSVQRCLSFASVHDLGWRERGRDHLQSARAGAAGKNVGGLRRRSRRSRLLRQGALYRTADLASDQRGRRWGARIDQDGINTTQHVSMCTVKNIPVEVVEARLPVMVDRAGFRQDSGGPGRFRGGLGSVRDYRFLAPFGALTILKKSRTPGWGLAGGKPGPLNLSILIPNTERPDWKQHFDRDIIVYADNSYLYDDKPADVIYCGMFRGEFEPGDVISYLADGGGG